MSLLFILIISAIRFDIGFDYKSYWQMVSNLQIQQEEFHYLEPTIQILIMIAREIKYPPIIFIIYAIITNLLFFCIIWKYTKYPAIGILVYCAFFYLPTLGFIRQGAALGIIMCSYPFLIRHQPIKFILTCIIASMFHYPALLAITIYPLYNLGNWKTLLFIISLIGISFTIIMQYIQLIFPQLSYLAYLKSLNNLTGGNMVRIVYLCLIMIFCALAFHKKQKDALKLVLISSLGVISSFALGGHIGGRIGWYFLIFLCISIPNILSYYPKIFSQIAKSCLCLIFLSTIYVSTLSKDKLQYTPYNTIFQINIDNPKFK